MEATCIGDPTAFPELIRACLDSNGEAPDNFPDRPDLRQASVFMPLFQVGDEWRVLFTRRSDVVADHKGQVSLPGGAAEPGENPVETACRELQEEVGIDPAAVQVLGQMKPFPTITAYLVLPVVGIIPWPVDLTINTDEVARTFSIPLCWLADAKNREERLYRLTDGSEHQVVFFSEYDGELLWGVTARIMVDFLEKIGFPGK